MNTDEIRGELQRRGGQVEDKSDRTLGISGHYLRTQIEGQLFFAVGGERDAKTRIEALVDGVHWCRCTYPKADKLTIVWGSRSGGRDTEVLDAIATICSCYQGELSLAPTLDFWAWDRAAPDLSGAGARWQGPLLERLKRSLPDRLRHLKAEVGHDSFHWYQSVTDDAWSGRVEGLEVCTADPEGVNGNLDVGRPGRTGKESDERLAFLRIAGGHRVRFTLPRDQRAVGEIIHRVAEARESGELARAQPEHRLESRILRGAVRVEVAGHGALEPLKLEVPFQFPTCWTPEGDARFVDALMRIGKTPWVVELKVPTGGQASYYRHAIAQAVLYREFIRGAKSLWTWFDQLGLDPATCRAVVAFPAMMGPRKNRLLKELQRSAGDFGVLAVPLESV